MSAVKKRRPFERWAELKRRVRSCQSEQDGLARFCGETAAADEHKAKAQAFAKVLRCMEYLEQPPNCGGE